MSEQINTTEKSVETNATDKLVENKAILPNVSINKFEAEIVLGGEKIVVKKLKAIKFYEAQKVFIKMMANAARIERETKDESIDVIDRNEKALEFAWTILPKLQIELLAVCIDKTAEEVGKLADPMEIKDAVDIVSKLNNFDEIIKKFEAPTKEK